MALSDCLLEEDDGRSALLPAARVGDTVLGFRFTQRSWPDRERYAGGLRPRGNKAVRLRGLGRYRVAGALGGNSGERGVGASFARHPAHAMMQSISAAALGHGERCARVEERRCQREAEQQRNRHS